MDVNELGVILGTAWTKLLAIPVEELALYVATSNMSRDNSPTGVRAKLLLSVAIQAQAIEKELLKRV